MHTAAVPRMAWWQVVACDGQRAGAVVPCTLTRTPSGRLMLTADEVPFVVAYYAANIELIFQAFK